MLKRTRKVLQRLFRAEDRQDLATPSSEVARFLLQFDELEVGTLGLSEGVWEFRYTPQFRSQMAAEGGVHPLIDFPDVNRVYRSEELWPFFMARIPSISQPQILEEIQKKGLDKKNPVQLLRAFGERSIANPFLLRSA